MSKLRKILIAGTFFLGGALANSIDVGDTEVFEFYGQVYSAVGVKKINPNVRQTVSDTKIYFDFLGFREPILTWTEVNQTFPNFEFYEGVQSNNGDLYSLAGKVVEWKVLPKHDALWYLLQRRYKISNNP